MFAKLTYALLICLTCFVVSLSAQTETGSMSGVIVDQQDAPVAGASVKLTSNATGTARTVTSDGHGNFSFNAVQPGAYALAIEQAGFRRYEKTNMVLEPSDHLALGKIQLQLGAVTDVVTVTAEGALVQTESSERSGIITDEQVKHLTVINRDFTFLASLQPGIVANTSADSQGFRGGITFNANGGRTGQNNITVDGVPLENSNTGNMNTFISMDAISTVKIESSGYQAEFGRKPGAAIQAVTKSGTRDYHGGVYWYQRNETFNATPFFNKAAKPSLPKPVYRYISAGLNVGGPVYIPKLIHSGQNKFFFFFNEEQQRELRPQSPIFLTVPTIAERNGDFSKSGKTLTDPRNCGPSQNQACLIDSTHVNRDMINPQMQKYLNLLPLPTTDTPIVSQANANFQFQESTRIPKHNEVARIDYILSPRTTIYGVFNYWSEEEVGNNIPAGSTKWGWLPASYAPKSSTLNLAGTHSFSSTLFLEVSMSGSRWTEAAHPQQQALTARSRSATGINLPQFHPELNPLDLLPQATFDNVTTSSSNRPNVTYDGRFPIRGAENVFTWSGTMTKVHGRHTAKAGIFVEHWQQLKGENGNFVGTFDFSSSISGFDASNGNTGNDFANALIGNFGSYVESTTRPVLLGRYNGVEWFAQDNWKVSPRLVLDLGLRFGWSQPFHSPDLNEAGFVTQRFDPAKAVRLIESTTANCGSLGSPCGVDPITKKTFPRVAIGSIVPGSGNVINGTVNRNQNPDYPQGLRNSSGIKVGPRLGFAYDPVGRSNTVVRGGFGLFYDFRERDNFYVNISKTPPLQFNPKISPQNIRNLLLAGTGFLAPSDTLSLERGRPLPYIMEFSLGIQQNIAFKTVADIAYVGSLGRHLLWQRNLNAIPFGTVPSSGALTNNSYRPFVGYGNILESDYAGTSNYHSLQVAVNRRFARSLQFGVAWTWSKAMDFVDAENNQISNLINPRIWNYGMSGFDHTHIVRASFTWDVPKISRSWDNGFAREVFDDWTISGTPTFQSGAPIGITFNDPNNKISQSPTDGSRVVVLQSPILPKDQRTVDRYFDTTAIGKPAQGTPGNAAKNVFRGPGINNWDLAVFKNIRLPRENLRLQFRAEAYNAFNHTQFSDVDITARFDSAGNQTSASLGRVNAARANRRMQVALRLSF